MDRVVGDESAETAGLSDAGLARVDAALAL